MPSFKNSTQDGFIFACFTLFIYLFIFFFVDTENAFKQVHMSEWITARKPQQLHVSAHEILTENAA